MATTLAKRNGKKVGDEAAETGYELAVTPEKQKLMTVFGTSGTVTRKQVLTAPPFISSRAMAPFTSIIGKLVEIIHSPRKEFKTLCLVLENSEGNRCCFPAVKIVADALKLPTEVDEDDDIPENAFIGEWLRITKLGEGKSKKFASDKDETKGVYSKWEVEVVSAPTPIDEE